MIRPKGLCFELSFSSMAAIATEMRRTSTSTGPNMLREDANSEGRVAVALAARRHKDQASASCGKRDSVIRFGKLYCDSGN